MVVLHTTAWAARPFTALSRSILPMLRERGVDAATLTRLTEQNPFDAYAR